MNLNKKFKRNKGITLIALVVTIIVLLILAGISISMLTGQNGILNRAAEAKSKNGTAQNEDLVKLSTMDALSQGLGTITDANLKTALNNHIGEGKYEITGDATNGWTVTVDGKDYRVEATGIVNGNGSSTGSVNWNKILEDANKNPESMKHKEQVKSSFIGIGTDGKPVNMDLWKPTKDGDGWSLMSIMSAYEQEYAYNGGIDDDGKIVGKIPQYIYNGEEGKFTEVTDLTYTFLHCTGLRIAPEIPGSVTSMASTFQDCTGLTTAPEIPNSVTNISSTFSGCTGLTTAPEIPNSVTNMSNTFSGCTGLTTAPEIPNSVTNMPSAFSGCTGLTTAPEIPNSVTDMPSAFSGCTGLTTAPEIPNSVTNMIRTFYGCTGLTTAPKIPNSVTRIDYTFSGCTGLTTAPEIPGSVTSMENTFEGCTGLTTAPEIPNSVTNMIRTFDGCTNLTGEITINANLNSSDVSWCFWGTTKPIQLTGTCPILSKLAETSSKGNVTVK